MWKETVAVYVQFGYFPEGHEENQGTSQLAGASAKIRTGHLLNTSQQRRI
jgi:hypothetical protein